MSVYYLLGGTPVYFMALTQMQVLDLLAIPHQDIYMQI